MQYLMDHFSAEEKEHWDQLPDSLKQYINSQQTAETIIFLLNSDYSHSSKDVIYYSLYKATCSMGYKRGDPNLLYLYVFKDGYPIAVTFGNGYASGTFIPVTDDSLSTPEGVQKVFGQYQCEVIKINP